jgi:hypothetical protein
VDEEKYRAVIETCCRDRESDHSVKDRLDVVRIESVDGRRRVVGRLIYSLDERKQSVDPRFGVGIEPRGLHADFEVRDVGHRLPGVTGRVVERVN